MDSLHSKRSGNHARRYKAAIHYETNIPPTRIKKAELELSKKIVRKDDDRYDSLSHYIRCAIIKLNRAEKKRLRL